MAVRKHFEDTFDKAPYFDSIHRAYDKASPTREVIGGNYADDFAGVVRWSRALDFTVPGYPEFRGLRYIDFKDCTIVRVLFKDGNSIPMEDLDQKMLVDVNIYVVSI